MQFTISGRDVASALVKMSRVSGRDIDYVVLRANENIQRLEIHGNSVKQGRRAMVTVPATINRRGRAQLERVKVEGICKNRGELTFDFGSSGLSFTEKGTSYHGRNIAIVNYQKVDLLKITNDRGIPVEIQARLLKAIKACLITSVFGGKQLSLVLLVQKNRFYVIVADRFHSAIAEFRVSRDQRRRLRAIGFRKPLVLPIEYADMLATQFTSTGLNIQINSRSIVFANADLKVELPALQTEHLYITQALKLDEHIQANDINISEGAFILRLLDSIKVISKNNVPIKLSANKGKKSLDFIYDSPNGKIRDSIPTEHRVYSDMEVALEPNNFYDIATKLHKHVKIAHNKQLIRIMLELPDDKIRIRYYSAALQDKQRVTV
jgi:hypothetical protein